ncbi:unnamed protein product [Acanthoscelides obtectus]|uniref:Uncharacterized protein n=1 Tax=Acanthoscelides obtectus TaxID=200917 RepID=A0A9P0LKX3_ACAOB|nr:unnamed protein product [Acanthoscelides obtectus]CAK1629761.1 hypothetical protein AOBTE_LOCUS5932 [Acanthoscelides obtectus]
MPNGIEGVTNAGRSLVLVLRDFCFYFCSEFCGLKGIPTLLLVGFLKDMPLSVVAVRLSWQHHRRYDYNSGHLSTAATVPVTSSSQMASRHT